MNMPKNTPRPTTGPRFIPPPDSIFRRRPLVDAGLLALVGAALALVFAEVLVGLLETAFDARLRDVVRAVLLRQNTVFTKEIFCPIFDQL